VSGTPVRALVAPDAFRGSLDAPAVAAALARGVRAACAGVDVRELPVADGGEGTLDAAVAAGFAVRTVPARGPLGSDGTVAGESPGCHAGRSRIAIRDGRAVVELAELCGWPRMPRGRTAPLTATTLGLGDGIRAALDLGCRDIVVAVGGSVSTDGGAGMLVALGARLLDASGGDVEPDAFGLARLAAIDVTALDPRLGGTRIVLATDVENPLLGPHGAAAVFAPQKGASAQEVARLERALTRLADVVERATGVDVRHRPGCGAAGGIGAMAVPYLRAEIASGADIVLDLLDFDLLAAEADLVLTGEGCWDAQTAATKAPARVTARARRAGADVGVVAGVLAVAPSELTALGVCAACALSELQSDPQESIRDADRLVEQAAAVVTRRWREQMTSAR
jgi:glycerate 2-kinase